MNYRETLDYLFSRLPVYQRTGPAAYKANLDNTIALDNYFGHPHRAFQSIHVAGTNGKGSVSHMLASVLQSAGYKTGLYTSPHLVDFRERIRINGEKIPENYVVQFVKENRSVIEKIEPSFFEMTVLMAFRYFAEKKVDIAVIETGLGGRLDSTNIIDPIVSVLTNIGLDHTRFLGNSLEEIAFEKAGIIKPGRPVVVGKWQQETSGIFEARAEKTQSCLIYADKMYKTDYTLLTPERARILNIYAGRTLVYPNLISDLPGIYQQKNICTAIQTLDVLRTEDIKIPKESIYKGLKNVKRNTGLRGRWDEIGFNPLIVCDVAHNAEGVREVIAQLLSIPFKKLHIVWGMVSDKDISAILNLLPKEAYYYFTKADIPRALNENDLSKKAFALGLKGEKYPEVGKALEAAKENAVPEDVIFIGGSTFVVGEVLGYVE